MPALDGRDDPAWWREWARDPDFGKGWHSISTHLGITGVGIAGCTAAAGEELIVPHTETPYGGQEEVYVVVRGRAAFVCDEEPVELGEGELLFVEPHVVREARALESPTTVLAIGGMPGSFEVWAKPETRP